MTISPSWTKLRRHLLPAAAGRHRGGQLVLADHRADLLTLTPSAFAVAGPVQPLGHQGVEVAPSAASLMRPLSHPGGAGPNRRSPMATSESLQSLALPSYGCPSRHPRVHSGPGRLVARRREPSSCLPPCRSSPVSPPPASPAASSSPGCAGPPGHRRRPPAAGTAGIAKPYTGQARRHRHRLAVRFHAWTAELIAHNHLGRHRRLHVGQRIQIPVVRRRGPQGPERSRPRPHDGRATRHRPSTQQQDAPRARDRQPASTPTPSRPRLRPPGDRRHRAAARRQPAAGARGLLAGVRLADAPHLHAPARSAPCRCCPRTGPGCRCTPAAPLKLRHTRDNVARRGAAARRARRPDPLAAAPGRGLLPGPRRGPRARAVRRDQGATCATSGPSRQRLERGLAPGLSAGAPRHAAPLAHAAARRAAAPYHGVAADPSPSSRAAPEDQAVERTVERTCSDPMVGRLLDGRYRIGPRIARGGMATVYEATDLRLDRVVAVKVMHPGSATTTSSRPASCARPARAARLSHPNVVGVFDQGDDDGTVFLAMEYVPGHTLRDVIRKEAPMPPAKALALIEPVLSALAAAHAAGLIHRDVKPENVLHRRRRPGQGRRLRAGQGGQRRHPAHRDRRRADRHRVLPRPRAGRRRPRRRPRRRLRRRRRALRAAHRPQAARGRLPDPGRLQARARGRPAALGARRPACRRTSTRWSPAPPPATASHRPADARVLLHQVRRVEQALDEGVLDDPELVADLAPPLPVAVLEPEHEDHRLPSRDERAPRSVAARLAQDVASTTDDHTEPRSARATSERPSPAAPPPSARPTAPSRRSRPVRDRPRRSRRGPVLLLVALLLAVGGGAGALVVRLRPLHQHPRRHRPDRRPRPRPGSTTAGLGFRGRRQAYSETVAAGAGDQHRPGGRRAGPRRRHRRPRCVSLGQERYDVPDAARDQPRTRPRTRCAAPSLTFGELACRRSTATVARGQS